jgi:anaerobic selenocysteine-containing dehydrogenase
VLIIGSSKNAQSACVLCSNGCGVDIGVKNQRIVGVRGRPSDAVNRGRLGPKGLNGWEANNSADRLTHPLIRRAGKLEQASWTEAMDLIVARTREVRERYTASAIGFYTTGQLFLEEYYTLGVIGKAGLGTPHMDGNTRLCTATAAAALKETFGSDGQPGSYFDMDETDCILMVGHNMAATDSGLRGGGRFRAVYYEVWPTERRRAQASGQGSPGSAQAGGFHLVRDLHDLWLLVNESMMSLNVLEQAARAWSSWARSNTCNSATNGRRCG